MNRLVSSGMPAAAAAPICGEEACAAQRIIVAVGRSSGATPRGVRASDVPCSSRRPWDRARLENGVAVRVRDAALAVLLALALVLATVAAGPADRAAEAAPAAESPAQIDDPAGGFDGDPETTERVDHSDPVESAVRLSRARFADLAEVVVLSRVDAFPDSLAGSALTDRGPLLFTDPAALTAATAAELDRVLVDGATVYVLGGDRAVSPAVTDDLAGRGYRVRRLAGGSRVETAIAVADEVRRVRGDTGEALVARAFGVGAADDSAGWADAVTAGAYAADRGSPLLVTPTERLHPAVRAWLDDDRPARTAVLGGSDAVADAAVAGLPNATRYAGAERTATAAAVATGLWGAEAAGARRFLVVGGARPDGWTFGLAAAGAGADADAPVLMVTGSAAGTTRELLRSCGTPEVDLLVVGDGQAVADAVRRDLIALDGADCGSTEPPSRADTRRLAAYDGCAELLGAFQQRASAAMGAYGFTGFVGRASSDDAQEGAASSPPAPEAAGGGSADQDFSGTNVQEEGVDEPDLVKTDGVIAVAVAGGRVHVTDLAAQRLTGTVELPDGAFPTEVLLEARTALVLASTYELDTFDQTTDVYTPGVQRTALIRVDLSDPSAPQVLDTLQVDGGYVSARLVGGVARVVVASGPVPIPIIYGDGTPEGDEAALERNQDAIEATTLGSWLPQVTLSRAGEAVATEVPALGCDDVQAAGEETGLGLVSVLSIDLDRGVEPTSAAAVLASGNMVYASPDRLYVATGQWLASTEDGGPATDLHAFDISRPDATAYVGSGRVGGYLVNRYALSERDGLLRAAVTTERPWSSPEEAPSSQSSVVVLAEEGPDLVEVGRVDGLGEGERIYAVRYFDDLAAVVTFRQTDPLYLVDLADPTAPRVAGELKVPGFSEYLHRIDDDLLLAVGRDADADGTTRGLQLSTFDVGDPSAPRLVDRLPFAGEYTSSPAEYDPRAFLWWPPARRAVLPLETYDREDVAVEAVAVDVDEAGGLTEAGRVDHRELQPEGLCCAGISRSFVVGDDLWTLSEFGLADDGLVGLDRRATVPFPPPEGFSAQPVASGSPAPQPEPAPGSTEAPSDG